MNNHIRTSSATLKFKQSVTIWHRKMYDFFRKIGKALYLNWSSQNLLKRKVFYCKSSFKNIDVKKENEENKELIDLICQENCLRQEENASKNTIVKTLVENHAAISQAPSEYKNTIEQ